MKKIYLFAFILSAIFLFSTQVDAATSYTLKSKNMRLTAEAQGSGHLTIPGYKAVETALDCLPGNECSIKVPENSFYDLVLVPDKDSIAQWFTAPSNCDNSDPVCNIVAMNEDVSLTYLFKKKPVAKALDGLCGDATTGLYSSAPSSPLDLCATGTPTTVNGIGPWNWQCKGQNGGKDVSCSARSSVNTTPINGDCGSSNAGTFASVPTNNLCITGAPTFVNGNGPWDWQCLGSNNGSTSSCVAFSSNTSGGGASKATSTTTASGAGIVKLMKGINKVILNPLIIFLFACALMFFLYGVMQFVINPANEEMKKTGKSHMLWGVVGMVIMVSVFGIMQIILNTLGEKHIQIDSIGNYQVEKLK